MAKFLGTGRAREAVRASWDAAAIAAGAAAKPPPASSDAARACAPVPAGNMAPRFAGIGRGNPSAIRASWDAAARSIGLPSRAAEAPPLARQSGPPAIPSRNGTMPSNGKARRLISVSGRGEAI